MATRGVHGHHATSMAHGSCKPTGGLSIATLGCVLLPAFPGAAVQPDCLEFVAVFCNQRGCAVHRVVPGCLPSLHKRLQLLLPPRTASCADNLQTRLYFGTRYYHDLSVDALLHLSVFSDSSGVDINIDNHKAGEWSC